MVERIGKLARGDGSLGSRIRLVVILAAAIGLLYAGARWVHWRYTHVHLIDARVAAETVTVASRLPGWLVSRPAEEGQIVEVGQLLAEVYGENAKLDLAAMAVQLRAAEAEVRKLQAQIVQTRAATGAALEEAASRKVAAERALAVVGEQVKSLREDYQRDERLAAQQMVSAQRLLHSRTALSTAQMDFERQRAEVLAAEAQVRRAQAGTQIEALVADAERATAEAEQLRARIAAARLDVADRSIKSTIRAVIDRTYANPGDYLAAGQRILQMHDPARIWIEANAKETEIEHVRVGQEVEIDVDAYPDRVFRGKVIRIGNAATSTFALLPNPNPSGNFTKVTQRIPLRIEVQQVENLLRPGMMVEVTINVSGS